MTQTVYQAKRQPRKIKLTDEQREKSEARKARFRELAKHIASLSDDERSALASRCPVVTCEGRGLSAHNQCLIALQYPSATIVGGFRQWIKQGRAVRKGQSGMMIWVPCVKSGEKQSGGSQEPDETRFIMGTIFDVSQTDEIGGGA